MLPGDLIVVRNPAVRWRPEGPHGRHVAVASPAAGTIHLLNPSAAEVFLALDGTRRLRDVRGLLAARFDVPMEIIARDLDSTVCTLLDAGFCHVSREDQGDHASNRSDGRQG